MRILLVEDDSTLLSIYSDVLTEMGHQVTTADNGQQAVEVALERSLELDLVLMDIQMPVMDGLEATERLKAEVSTEPIPVIALTNLQLPSEVSAALEAGCDGYIAKPLDPEELGEELANLFLHDEVEG